MALPGKCSQLREQNNSQMDSEHKQNNTITGQALCLQQSGTSGQTYKLIIRVDKVRARPGPKSKKKELMAIAMNNIKHLNQINKSSRKDLMEITKKNDEVKIIADLPVVNYQKKVSLDVNNANESATKKIQSSISPQFFQSTQSVQNNKQNWICKYCDAPCESKSSLDSHEKTHLDTDPIFPYKCHLCSKTFLNRRDLTVHSKILHPEKKFIPKVESTVITLDDNSMDKLVEPTKYQCQICDITLESEDSYRSHVKTHSLEVENKNGDATTPNPESNSAENIKYPCQVCSKEFETPKELEAHKIMHTEKPQSEYKCTICKKLFKAEETLNDHLANHLYRAHHCLYCRKAFINRTTLKIHMRTHKNIP